MILNLSWSPRWKGYETFYHHQSLSFSTRFTTALATDILSTFLASSNSILVLFHRHNSDLMLPKPEIQTPVSPGPLLLLIVFSTDARTGDRRSVKNKQKHYTTQLTKYFLVKKKERRRKEIWSLLLAILLLYFLVKLDN